MYKIPMNVNQTNRAEFRKNLSELIKTITGTYPERYEYGYFFVPKRDVVMIKVTNNIKRQKDYGKYIRLTILFDPVNYTLEFHNSDVSMLFTYHADNMEPVSGKFSKHSVLFEQIKEDLKYTLEEQRGIFKGMGKYDLVYYCMERLGIEIHDTDDLKDLYIFAQRFIESDEMDPAKLYFNIGEQIPVESKCHSYRRFFKTLLECKDSYINTRLENIRNEWDHYYTFSLNFKNNQEIDNA